MLSDAASAIALALPTVHGVEVMFRLRRWTMDWLDFSGDALMRGRIWILLTSSMLHNNWAHMGRQSLLLLLVGPATERALGRKSFTAAYFISGAGACVFSWRLFRHRLLCDPSFHAIETDKDKQNVAFIADSCPSRGASACTYALSALAIIAVGDQPCCTSASFSFVNITAGAILALCRLTPDVFTPKRRLKEWWTYFAGVVAISALALPRSLDISTSLAVWWAIGMTNWKVSNLLPHHGGPTSGGACDWESHLAGIVFGAGWGLASCLPRHQQMDIVGLARRALALSLTIGCGLLD